MVQRKKKRGEKSSIQPRVLQLVTYHKVERNPLKQANRLASLPWAMVRFKRLEVKYHHRNYLALLWWVTVLAGLGSMRKLWEDCVFNRHFGLPKMQCLSEVIIPNKCGVRIFLLIRGIPSQFVNSYTSNTLNNDHIYNSNQI